MDVTRCPHAFNRTPTLLAVTPFPRPLTTPPVTSTYFMMFPLSICARQTQGGQDDDDGGDGGDGDDGETNLNSSGRWMG
jgi:hypothetical protein